MANTFYGTYSFLDVELKFALPSGFDFTTYGLDAAEIALTTDNILSINGSDARGVAQEGITIAPAETRNVMSYGADRSVMHNLIATKPATCMIRLLRVSPINRIFAKLYEVQTTSSRMHGYNTIQMFVNGEQCVSLLGVAFNNPPTDITFAREMTLLEWPFDVADLSVNFNEMAVMSYQPPTGTP